MINGINSQQSYVSQSMQTQRKPPSADEMFKNLTKDLGSDGTSITKDQLESYIKKLESESSDSDKGKLGFLKQLSANFDKISGGSDSITAENLKDGMEYLKPPSGAQGGSQAKSPADMFSDLSTKVGADDSGITKDELESYLEKLKENGQSDSKEAELISKLIENFDNVSAGTDSITSESLQSSFQSLFSNQNDVNSRYNWQDPSTITSDQLESPIDIRV